MPKSDFDTHYISQLVEQTKKGQSDAFAELFAATYQQEYEVAYNFLRDEELAQEALQKIYLITYRSILKIHAPEVFLPWLRQTNVRVLRKLIKDHGLSEPENADQPAEKVALSNKTADKMLEHIFKTYDLTPNAIPLDKLTTWGNFKRTDFRFCQILTGLMLLGLLLVPFSFIAPSVKISSNGEISNTAATYEMTIHSLLPVRAVSASLNGSSVPVEYVKSGSYQVTVLENGVLTVRTTLISGQQKAVSTEVDAIDREAPKYLSYTLNEGKLYIQAEDNKSGVDYKGVYAVNSDNGRQKPLSYDAETGAIVFEYNTASITIFIPDRIGNTLKITIGE